MAIYEVSVLVTVPVRVSVQADSDVEVERLAREAINDGDGGWLYESFDFVEDGLDIHDVIEEVE